MPANVAPTRIINIASAPFQTRTAPAARAPMTSTTTAFRSGLGSNSRFDVEESITSSVTDQTCISR